MSAQVGERVRVVGGDYAGRLGTYEGKREDALGEWHLVHLDGDHPSDSPLRCDSVVREREACDRCDLDSHRCPSCGVPVPHGVAACEDCA